MVGLREGGLGCKYGTQILESFSYSNAADREKQLELDQFKV